MAADDTMRHIRLPAALVARMDKIQQANGLTQQGLSVLALTIGVEALERIATVADDVTVDMFGAAAAMVVRP